MKCIIFAAFFFMAEVFAMNEVKFNCTLDVGRYSHQITTISDTILVGTPDSVWYMNAQELECINKPNVRRLSTWLKIMEPGYDSGSWVSLYVKGGRFDFCQSTNFRNVKSFGDSAFKDSAWGVSFGYALPWYALESKCDETKFGYPKLAPNNKWWGWTIPDDTVRGLMVFQLLAGTDTVYNSIPFQLSGWTSTYYPLDTKKQVIESAGPIRRSSGWLFPSSLAAERFVVFTPQGRRVQVHQEATSEGVILHVSEGRGLLVVQAGSHRWKLMR